MEKYKTFDWIGNISFDEIKNLPKNKSAELLNAFIKGNNNRIYELKKLINSEIILDYSIESIDYLSYWLFSKIEENKFSSFLSDEEKIEFTYDKSSFNIKLPKFYRSLANDITIYIAHVQEKNFDNAKIEWGLCKKSKRYDNNNWIGYSLWLNDYLDSDMMYIYEHIYNMLSGVYNSDIKGYILDRYFIRRYMSKIGFDSLNDLPKIPTELLEKMKMDIRNTPICVLYTSEEIEKELEELEVFLRG